MCIDEKTLTVHIPMQMKRWGARRVIVAPTGEDLRKLDKTLRQDKKLLKAIARAYKWGKWLETGKYKSVDEIADKENINRSYITRILRINRLSPRIVEAVLDGRQPDGFGLPSVEVAFPDIWEEQERLFGFIK